MFRVVKRLKKNVCPMEKKRSNLTQCPAHTCSTSTTAAAPRSAQTTAKESIVYVNGKFVPASQAKVSVFDRGFLLADAVYEVSSVLRGSLIDNKAHLHRLRRSLSELRMESPASDGEIEAIQLELIRRNSIFEGLVYLQITRGATIGSRSFPFPSAVEGGGGTTIPTMTPTLVLFAQAKKIISNPIASVGMSVITVPDLRWKRRDIKTVGLLAQALAKQAALDAGADDAWMVENGFVTEGASSNAFIITRDGRIVTRPLGNEILSGITRHVVLRFASREDLVVEERPFTVDEALGALEAFSTSSTTFVMPVVSIDSHPVGDGSPGRLTRSLREYYIARALVGGNKDVKDTLAN